MRKFVTFLVILLILALGVLWFVSTGYYSSGDRAGTVSKFGERGYIFKTFEGQLMEGGYSGDTGSLSPRYWDFSSKEDSVVAKIKKALSTGERVTLLYHEKYILFPWNGETKFMVYDVVFLPKADKQSGIGRREIEQPTEQTTVTPVDSLSNSEML